MFGLSIQAKPKYHGFVYRGNLNRKTALTGKRLVLNDEFGGRNAVVRSHLEQIDTGCEIADVD